MYKIHVQCSSFAFSKTFSPVTFLISLSFEFFSYISLVVEGCHVTRIAFNQGMLCVLASPPKNPLLQGDTLASSVCTTHTICAFQIWLWRVVQRLAGVPEHLSGGSAGAFCGTGLAKLSGEGKKQGREDRQEGRETNGAFSNPC